MLHHERNQDPVFEVNPKNLFKQAIRQKIPFPHWYIWADERIQELTQLRKDQLATDQYRTDQSKKVRGGDKTKSGTASRYPADTTA